jgi:hypothetical protein
LALAALAAVTQIPLPGPTWALVKGVLLAGLQVGLALSLVGVAGETETRPAQLAWHRPAHAAAWLAVAVATGFALSNAARLALDLVPSSGRAPIETFIAWPSGMLAFGALGMLLPVAEEVFFRGYLYRTALRWGHAGAFALSLLAFVALHAQQSWGNWGGLLAIFMTGTLLTALRAASGSTAIPAVAHLLYNFTLSLRSF